MWFWPCALQVLRSIFNTLCGCLFKFSSFWGIAHLVESVDNNQALVCVKEKNIPNCKKPPPVKDPFDASVNRDAVEVLKTILTFNRDIRARNNTYIAEQAAIRNNFTVIQVLFKKKHIKYFP